MNAYNIVSIVCCGIAIVVGAGILIALLLDRRPSATLRGHTVVVQTTGEAVLRGVLLHEHADRLTLAQVEYVTGGGEQPMGGLVHVPRAQVAWLQEL